MTQIKTLIICQGWPNCGSSNLCMGLFELLEKVSAVFLFHFLFLLQSVENLQVVPKRIMVSQKREIANTFMFSDFYVAVPCNLGFTICGSYIEQVWPSLICTNKIFKTVNSVVTIMIVKGTVKFQSPTFLLPPHIYLRVLSCISVLLVTAMHDKSIAFIQYNYNFY